MTTDLARRELSATEVKRRIEMNKAARYGLETATSAQLNIIYTLALRWGLDPVTDLTLYQGRPFITIEGHLRLLRKHPEYRGFAQRPLSESEKELWGYDPTDVVVETCVRTATWGDIVQRGLVTRAEIDQARAAAERSGKAAAPVATHYVALAEKRSLARAHRAAFGQDVPDDETIDQELEDERARRTDVREVEQLANQYVQIFGTDDQPDPPSAPPPHQPAPSSAGEPASPPSRSQLWQENRELVARALELGVAGVPPTLHTRSTDDVIVTANEDLRARVRKAEADIFAAVNHPLEQQQEAPS